MVFIIAEAGVNHNGDFDKAYRLIMKAAMAGADAVKFQLFSAEKLEPPGPRRDMLKALELPWGSFVLLSSHANDVGIEFMATPFDVESLEFLAGLGCKKVKIGSGLLSDDALIAAAFEKFDTVILSTGMMNWDRDSIPQKATLMHCVSAYPCPIDQLNLRAVMDHDGLSDHTLSTVIPAAAVAMGASVIEKHLTLDRNMEGPDHKASLEPQEFAEMVRNIREVEAAMGDGVKRPMPCEAAVMKIRDEREKWRTGQNAS